MKKVLMEKNNFKELENYKIEEFGEVPKKVIENVEKNRNLFSTIGETLDLFTEKMIQTIIKINK
ncbi:MAG: hypothetical protein ACM3PT_00605 [Deltaproteobacteria bacterium]